ncbi:MAG: rod shape-determining protein MreC [Spirochaetales bacterium]|nr:rod shape-determining protein MreC [Spirochaetales bacterium]
MADRDDGGARPEAVLAVLLILSVLLLISSSSFRVGVGGRIVPAIQRTAGGMTEWIKDGFGSLKRLRKLRESHEEALEKLGSYQGLERELVELRRENAQLRRQLGYSAGIEYTHIPAQIVASDPANLFDTITIDKGANDGVQTGMVVTAFQNGFFGLLGKVIAAGPRTAQVRPILDPDSYVAARLQEERYEGLVEGLGNDDGELLMRYVRKEAVDAIRVHDLVITSGMQSLYPEGIAIARVREVQARDYATSLELRLTPIVDVTRAEYVFVLGAGE